MCLCRPACLYAGGGRNAGERLSRKRPRHRPSDAAPRGLCGGRAGRAGAAGRLDRLRRTLYAPARTARHSPPVGFVGGLQKRRYAGIHRVGGHALYRDRAGGGRHAARSRDRRALAVPGHGRKSRWIAGDRPAGDREESRRQPRRLAHRALLSRRVVLARGLSQRPDRARRRPFGEQILHGRHRDPQYQPFRHAGSHGRSGEHRQCRPDPRDQLLHRGFPGRPFRGAEFRAGFPAAGRESRKADLQGDAGSVGSRADRQRAYRRENLLPLLAAAVLPAIAVQDDRPAVPAQLYRRTVQGQDALFGARRTDGAGAGGLRQHETQPRRGGRGRRIPAELPAPDPSGDLYRRRVVAALCGPSRADRHAEPHLPEQPQPQIPRQRRLFGGEPHPAAALRGAENHAAG